MNTAREDLDDGSESNEAGTTTHSPAEQSTAISTPAPAHGITSIGTKETEQTVAVTTSGGGAHGTSVAADGCNLDYGIVQKHDYWILFPERHDSAPHKENTSKEIGYDRHPGQHYQAP